MIIGITGPKGGGKDTAADYLVKCMPWRKKVSFADPFKIMLREGLGLTDEQLWGSEKDTVDPRYAVTPRYLLQTIGTEWGRDMVKNDIWVRALESMVGDTPVIVADVRNVPGDIEAQFIRAKGVLIHVEGRTEFTREHLTETPILPHFGDVIVDNSGTLEDLYIELTPVVDAFTEWK